MARRLIATLLLAAFLLSPHTLAGASAISVRVNPQVCFAPCTVTVQLHVSTHPPNSYAITQIDGPNYFAQGKVPLPDDDRPFLLPAIPYRSIGPGTYLVSGILVTGDTEDEEKWIAGDTKQLIVSGPGDEP